MRVSRFDTGPWPAVAEKGWRRVAYAALHHILPKANPDLDSAYERVQYWWLEIADDGMVTREVAFDASDHPIAAAPLGDNLGIFTDIDAAPSPLGVDIEQRAFEEAWDQVQERLRS